MFARRPGAALNMPKVKRERREDDDEPRNGADDRADANGDDHEEPRERRIGETDTQARAGSERPKMDPEAPLHPGEGPWRSLPTEGGFRN